MQGKHASHRQFFISYNVGCHWVCHDHGICQVHVFATQTEYKCRCRPVLACTRSKIHLFSEFMCCSLLFSFLFYSCFIYYQIIFMLFVLLVIKRKTNKMRKNILKYFIGFNFFLVVTYRYYYFTLTIIFITVSFAKKLAIVRLQLTIKYI